jgi:hypothetical protein
MALLAGAMIFNRPGEAEAVGRTVAQTAAATGGLHQELLFKCDWLVVYRLTRPVEGVQDAAIDKAGGRSWLIGDLNYAGADAMASARKAVPNNAEAAREVPGRWHLLEVDETRRCLRIASDVLGVMFLYVGRRRDGFVFANDFAAVVAGLDRTPTIDVDTALLELAMGSAPDDRTVFREVSFAPAGGAIELSDAGTRLVWTMPVEYGDRHHALTEESKYELMDELYAYTVRQHVRPFSEGLYISLSAGYDSRYGLALTRANGIPTGLATFGHPMSTEIIDCHEVCDRIGTRSEVFPAQQEDWNEWRDMVQMLGVTRVMQWSGWGLSWGQFLRGRARSVLHGAMGDAASGKRLHYFREDRADWLTPWLADWAGWDIGNPSSAPAFVRPDAARRLANGAVDRYRSALSEVSFAIPCQQAHHLNWYGRQRRQSCGQVNVMQRYVTPVCMHINARLLDFWRNVSASDLDHQRLYLSYARSRFPELFKAGDMPGAGRGIGDRFVEKLRRVKRTIQGRDTLAVRPPVLDRDRVLLANRAAVRDLVQRTGHMAGDLIDVTKLLTHVDTHGTSTGGPNEHLMPAVNLLMLLETAR